MRRLLHSFQKNVLTQPFRLLMTIFLLALVLIPVLSSEPYLLRILILTIIFAIYAASWDLLAGFTGQLSFGHAFFFGSGAYAAALLNLSLGLPPLLTIPLGAAITVIPGLLLALPALRLRGSYLSVATLAFPVILSGAVTAFPQFSGGEYGLYGVSRLFSSYTATYYSYLLIMLVCLFIMWQLTRTRSTRIRTGLIFQAIRDDEIVARASGINTVRYKLLAFATSAFFAGLAGTLYVHFMTIAGPSTLDLSFSFNPVIWTIFGGMTSIYGAVAGVFILYPLSEALRIVPELRMLLYTILIVLILTYLPEGITYWIRRKIEIRCPACKQVNFPLRTNCRHCGASLRD